MIKKIRKIFIVVLFSILIMTPSIINAVETENISWTEDGIQFFNSDKCIEWGNQNLMSNEGDELLKRSILAKDNGNRNFSFLASNAMTACIDPYNFNGYNSSKSNIYIRSYIDIDGADAKIYIADFGELKVYYDGYGAGHWWRPRLEDKVVETKNEYENARLAYMSYLCGTYNKAPRDGNKSEYEFNRDGAVVGSQYELGKYYNTWLNTWRKEFANFRGYLTSIDLNGIVTPTKENINENCFNWMNSYDSDVSGYSPILENDANFYADFATQGKTLEEKKDNEEIIHVIQDGNIIRGIEFSKYVVDNNVYESIIRKKNDEENYCYDYEHGTEQEIAINVILEDGRIIDNNLKVLDDEGNEITTKDIVSGKQYSLLISDLEQSDKIKSVKFISSYYKFRGRILMFASDELDHQAIIIVAGDKYRTSDIAEFPVDKEVTENSPVLVLKKIDNTGVSLQDATFDLTFKYDEQTETLTGRNTNDAGEIIVYTGDLSKINLNRIIDEGGTIEVTLKETEAPDGFKKLDETTIEITYVDGKPIVLNKSENDKIEVKTETITYPTSDNQIISVDVAVIVAKNDPLATLKIRKIEADTEGQDFLEGARFKVDIRANQETITITKSVDNNGYIDLTNDVNNLVNILGKYTGNIQIDITELENPTNFLKINEKISITLSYENGYLMKVIYPDNDNLSRDIIDVGMSEDRHDVTIAVKNTKYALQPIYLSKIDSVTKIGIADVGFKVVISRPDENENMTSKEFTEYTTSDGILAITESYLKEIGLTDWYTGEVYVKIEELSAKAGYKKLENSVNVKITYNNGNVDTAVVNEENVPVTCIISEIEKDEQKVKILKIAVENEWKIPELVISKESLSNDITEIINNAKFEIRITDNNTGRVIKSGTYNVNNGGKIVFTSEELESAGINGRYTGELGIHIKETEVNGAIILPEEVDVTLELKDGRYVNGSSSHEIYTSIVNNVSNINVKVLNYKKVEYMPISGRVWKELATTKAQGTLVDGIYTKMSDSEYSDKYFEGVEVTLYKITDAGLKFVNVTKGTNPTFTDAEGRYEFQVPNGNTKYVVRFTYNGEEFYSAPSERYDALTEFEEWKQTSKGSEAKGNVRGTRQYVNGLLAEIGSYPANYKMSNKLFDKNKIKETNNLRVAYEQGYNVAYTYGEIEEIYIKIAEAMKNKLKEEQNINISSEAGLNSLKEVYETVAGQYKDDEEIYNKLQYIFDTRVDSYAGYNTKAEGITSISEFYPYPGATSKDYREQQYVNLGLAKRDKTDLSLIEDIAEVRISTNGKDTIFNHNESKSVYKEELDKVDYGDEEEDLDLYVTYKLTIKNSTNTNTRLKEVVDYYRKIYSFADSYTTKENKELVGVEAIKVKVNGEEENIDSFEVNSTGKYIAESRIGLNGQDEENGYNELYITFNDGEEPVLVTGERLEIYVTLKLGADGKTAKDMLEEFAQGEDELSENNYAEINGYKTEISTLDYNSKPGTFNVKAYENAKTEYISAYANRNENKQAFTEALNKLNRIRENDAWSISTIYTKFGYSLNVKLSQRVSNIKLYLQDGTLQLNADFDKDGNVTYNNDGYKNIVKVVGPTIYDRDGLIQTVIDEELLSGSTLEVTYTITAIAEGNNTSNKKVRILDLVDYIEPGMNFWGYNKNGERINSNWEFASYDSFDSTRKGKSELLSEKTTVIRAADSNELKEEMKAGDVKETTITLSKVLTANKLGTGDIEVSNLAEIVKLSNTKAVKQVYDITGKERTETSFAESELGEVETIENIYTTLGTAKSETIRFQAPEGQNRFESILSNTIIVLISLSILAGGIVLIKKVVLKDRS